MRVRIDEHVVVEAVDRGVQRYVVDPDLDSRKTAYVTEVVERGGCACGKRREALSHTSTRDIAEKVGIRQASLYYHFAGKPGILAELLELSVRPSLDQVEKIERECPGDVPEAALYLLALIDAVTLATVPHNIGRLYRMPDVRSSEVFGEFEPALRELRAAYSRLGAAVVSGPVAASVGVDQLGGLLDQVVEVVIRVRSRGDEVTRAHARAIAATCLRVCGVRDARITLAATAAEEVMPMFATDARSRGVGG